jgi:hypothetical protein
MARRAFGLLALVEALATADFYTSDGGTGDCMTPSTPCPLATAVMDAGLTPGGANVHVIGPLTVSTEVKLPPMGASNPVHLLGSGSGPGGTVINGGGLSALELNNGSSADNLHATSAADTVILHYGSSITNSLIETSASDAAVNANFGATLPALVQNDTLNAPNGFAAIVGNGAAGMTLVIQDSTLNGMFGVNHTGGVAASVVIQRSTINASVNGIEWSVNQDAHFSVSSSVIHMTGPAAHGVVMSTFAQANTLALIEDTIDGADTSGQSSGVLVGAGSSGPPRQLVADVNDSIVRGFQTDLLAQNSTSASTPGGLIEVSRSDFGTALGQPPPPMTIGSPGAIGFGSGNLNVDPLFRNRAAGDYSLQAGSPVIDAAGTDPIDTAGQESATDKIGAPRIVDGNGDGTAARDMGALEFVPPQPSPGGASGGSSKLRVKVPRGRRLLVFPPGLLKLRMSCVGPAGSICSVSVVARSAKPVSTSAKKRRIVIVGRGHGRISAGKSSVIKVKLSRLGRRLFNHGKLGKVKLTASVRQASGPAQKIQHTYALKKAPHKRTKR